MEEEDKGNNNSNGKSDTAFLAGLSDASKCEYQYLKVPVENFKKCVRNSHRFFERELDAVMQRIEEARESSCSDVEAIEKIGSIVAKLQGVKRKVFVMFAYSPHHHICLLRFLVEKFLDFFNILF